MRSTVEIGRRKLFLVILLLLFGAILSTSIVVKRSYKMNWVTVTVLGDAKVEDVTITVGTNRLFVGSVWPGYKYKYAFRSPGEGSVEFEGTIAGEYIKCGIGYFDSLSSGTDTLIEISDQPEIRMYHGAQYDPFGRPRQCGPAPKSDKAISG